MKTNLLKVVISLSLVLQVLTPFGVQRVQAEETTEIEQTVKQKNSFPKRTKNKQELTAQKTELSNTYLNEDGTFTTDIYSEPIQYKDKNKQWKEIKNELKESKKEGFTFENTENSFKSFFNDQGEMIIDEDGKEISFRLKNPDKIKPTANKNLLGYKNIFKHTDLNYAITPSSVKEELILKNSNAPTTFTYELETVKLTPRINEDHSISFLDDKEEKYRMQPFFAYDSKENYAPTIVPEIIKTEKGYEIKINLDETWFNDKGRKFPIVVDPTIVSTNNPGSAFVYSSEPATTFNAWSYTRVGNNGYGKSRTYIEFGLSQLPTGAVIDNAELSLYQTLTNSANTVVDLHQITSWWEYYSVNWNEQPTYNAIPIGSETFNTTGYGTYDITELASDWYKGKTTNFGFMLKAKDENGAKREFASALNSDVNKIPKISITYHIDGLGSEDFWSYDNNINLNNGNLVLSEEDVSLDGRGHGINISRTYNSRSNEAGSLGHGWQLNTDMRFIFSEKEPILSGMMTFIDSDGTETVFAHSGSYGSYEWYPNESFDGTVIHNSLLPSFQEIWLNDKNHNNYIFDMHTGRMTSSIDSNKNETTYTYDTNQHLSYITDPSGRKAHFVYENGKLIKVFGNEITTVQYSYTGDYLTKVENISTSGDVLSVTMYEYDSNGNLTKITDAKNQATEIQYTSDDRVSAFVEKVAENGSITTLNTTYTYDFVTYDTVVTTKTNPKGIKTRFHTNDAGNIVKIENNYNVSTGTAETTEEYEWDQNHLLTSVSDAKKNITSYSYNENRDVNSITDPNLSKELFKYNGYDLSQYTSKIGETSQSFYDMNHNEETSIDQNGNATITERDSFGNVIKASTPISFAENLVPNSGFEKWTSGLPTTWSLYGSSILSNVLNSTGRPNGKSSVRLTSASATSPTQIISDYIPVYENSTYNLSWYGYQLNNGTTNVKIRWYSSTTTFLTEETIGTITGETAIWLRRNSQVIAPSTAIYGRIVLSSTNAITYFDNIQMEQGQFSNEGNLLLNDSFENDQDKNGLPDNWLNTKNVSIDSSNASTGEKSVKIVGDGTTMLYSNQEFEISGKKGTVIDFSGYSKASQLSGDYSLVLRVENTDGTISYFYNIYNKGTHDWEYKSKEVVLTKDFKRFNIYGQLNKLTGTAWFDDIELNITSSDNAQMSSYNLADNGSFEKTGSSGNVIDWFPHSKNTGTVYRVSSEQNEPVYLGDYAYRISNASASTNSIIHDHFELIKPGKSYTLSAMVKTDNVTAGGAKLVFQIYDSSNAFLTAKYSEKTVTNTTDWQRIYVTISEKEAKALNANAYQLRGLLHTQKGTTGKVYFDAVKFEENSLLSSVTYDTKGNYVTSETNQNGNTVNYTNNKQGKTTKVEFIKPGNTFEATYDELGRPTSTKDPRNVTTEITYDATGKVTEIKYKKTSDNSLINSIRNEYNELKELVKSYDANNYVTSFEHDLNRNVTKTILPNGKSILYQYNELDYLTNVSFVGDENRFSFEYDKNGNLTKETKNETEITNYIIDTKIDQISKITNPSGSSVDISYDRSGNITNYKHSLFNQPTTFQYSSTGMHEKTIAPFGIETNRTYDEKGQLNTLQVKNGTTILIYHYEYNQLGQLVKKWVETSTGIKLSEDEMFSYDTEGNIIQISYSNKDKDIFTYDLNGRLLSEKRLKSDASVFYQRYYTYDELGNRLTLSNGENATNHTYDVANQLLSDGTNHYTYDKSGNLLSDGKLNYSYTGTNQIKEIKNNKNNIIASYEYNSNGLRTKKTTPEGVEKYIYFSGDLEYITDENNKVKYSFVRDNNGTYVGFVDHTSVTPITYHYVLNYRRDVIALKNNSGAVVATYSYDSFGNLLSSTGNTTLGNGKLLKDENPIRYASYHFDNETKLYYVKARYYNAELGRFTTRDPIQQDNLYIYAENNPVMYIDDTGEFPFLLAAAVFPGISAATLAAAAAISIRVVMVAGAIAGTYYYHKGKTRYISGNPKCEPEGNKRETENARKRGVARAWKEEVALVKKTGEGTVDWTPKEKKELLKNGKVKGYQGHHIFNVKCFPSMADNPNNINFLKHKDHLNAHGGFTKNNTSGRLINRKKLMNK